MCDLNASVRGRASPSRKSFKRHLIVKLDVSTPHGDIWQLSWMFSFSSNPLVASSSEFSLLICIKYLDENNNILCRREKLVIELRHSEAGVKFINPPPHCGTPWGHTAMAFLFWLVGGGLWLTPPFLMDYRYSDIE